MNKFYELAKVKGWHDAPLNVPEKIALIHSEASEALECYREGQMGVVINCDRDGKPEGFPTELADIVIRCYDLAGALGFDLDEIIEKKHEYNKKRPYRHGNKTC